MHIESEAVLPAVRVLDRYYEGVIHDHVMYEPCGVMIHVQVMHGPCEMMAWKMSDAEVIQSG